MKRIKRMRMRQVLAIVAMLGSAWALVNAATAAGSQGTSFRFKLKGDRFVLEASQRFDSRKSLDEVRAVYSDHRLLPEISNLVTNVVMRPQGDSSYILETTATKSIDAGVKIEKSAVTVNRCTEKSGDSRIRFWERRCSVAMDRGDAAKFMYEGKSTLRCEEPAGKGSVSCVTRTEVRPKAIKYWPVYVRTPQQLAAAAGREALHDLGILLLIANTSKSPRDAKAEFDGTLLDKLSLSLFNDVRAKAERNEIGNDMLVIEASDQSGEYNVRIQ